MSNSDAIHRKQYQRLSKEIERILKKVEVLQRGINSAYIKLGIPRHYTHGLNEVYDNAIRAVEKEVGDYISEENNQLSGLYKELEDQLTTGSITSDAYKAKIKKIKNNLSHRVSRRRYNLLIEASGKIKKIYKNEEVLLGRLLQQLNSQVSRRPKVTEHSVTCSPDQVKLIEAASAAFDVDEGASAAPVAPIACATPPSACASPPTKKRRVVREVGSVEKADSVRNAQVFNDFPDDSDFGDAVMDAANAIKGLSEEEVEQRAFLAGIDDRLGQVSSDGDGLDDLMRASSFAMSPQASPRFFIARPVPELQQRTVSDDDLFDVFGLNEM
ncbi:MAG: hypothetical protein P1U63_12740 [Coxiellaceae bacterium]|nr:hypothetical protein [Coxiellaceae bacterium]